MPKKVFLCNKEADKDMVSFFKKKEYTVMVLTKEPKDFWTAVGMVDKGGYLALLSHGDEEGPLMVDGEMGDSMTKDDIQNFGKALVNANVTLYLLSCHTGNDPFFSALKATGCKFVAPLGFAKTQSSVAGTAVFSVEEGKAKTTFPGWVGHSDLVPNRGTKPLNIA
jgi:hypothetical protein